MVLTAMHNGGKIITDAYNLNQTNMVPENVIKKKNSNHHMVSVP